MGVLAYAGIYLGGGRDGVFTLRQAQGERGVPMGSGFRRNEGRKSGNDGGGFTLRQAQGERGVPMGSGFRRNEGRKSGNDGGGSPFVRLRVNGESRWVPAFAGMRGGRVGMTGGGFALRQAQGERGVPMGSGFRRNEGRKRGNDGGGGSPFDRLRVNGESRWVPAFAGMRGGRVGMTGGVHPSTGSG